MYPVVQPAILRIGQAVMSAPAPAKRSFFSSLKNSDFFKGALASGGISAVLELVESDNSLLDSLLDIAADALGYVPEDSTMLVEAETDEATKASNQLDAIYKDDGSITVSKNEADRYGQLEELGRFLSSQISGNPAAVVEFHAKMREFLGMDNDSVAAFASRFIR